MAYDIACRAVIVTGSRSWTERHQVDLALDNCLNAGFGLVIQGGCDIGADAMAREWCERKGVPCVTVHAWWSFYGDAAGPKRNAWMAALGAKLPDTIVIAFIGSGLARGTRNCIAHAKAAGLPVFEAFEEIPF